MFDTLALLVSEIYQAVGSYPPEIITVEDIVAEVWEKLGLYGLDQQQSSQGRITKSVPFTANSRDVALTMAPDIMLPSYVERKAGTEPNERYTYINVFQQAYLEVVRSRGESGCAFFRTALGWQLRFSYSPIGYPHRLHYYAAPIVPESLDDPLPLPKHFAFLIKNAAIPGVVIKMVNNSAKLEFSKQLTSLQIQALGTVAEHAAAEEVKWEKRFEIENNANKNPKPRPRRALISRGRAMRRIY